MVLTRIRHAETPLLTARTLNEDCVVELGEINRDPSRCGHRMRLGSHRQRTSVACENLKDTLGDAKSSFLQMYCGSEFIALTLAEWAERKNIVLDFIEPTTGVERFHRMFQWQLPMWRAGYARHSQYHRSA